MGRGGGGGGFSMDVERSYCLKKRAIGMEWKNDLQTGGIVCVAYPREVGTGLLFNILGYWRVRAGQ